MTRLDHYMNFGEQKLQIEQFAVVLGVVLTLSLFMCCVITSSVSSDDKMLGELRKTYRQRLRKAKRRVRTIKDQKQGG